jgi:hypothetical protein
MSGEPARLTVAAMPVVVGDCELCAGVGVELNAAVLVSHARGGSVRFNACDRCTQAMRRVVAAVGGHGAVIGGTSSAVPEPLDAAGVSFAQSPVLIGTLPDGFVDADGMRYIVRLYGHRRVDDTWIGWIEFEAADTGVTLRTGRETTQSNREQLTYWASGLEPTYFDGAFARAR